MHPCICTAAKFTSVGGGLLWLATFTSVAVSSSWLINCSAHSADLGIAAFFDPAVPSNTEQSFQRHIENYNPCIRASVWMNWIDTQNFNHEPFKQCMYEYVSSSSLSFNQLFYDCLDVLRCCSVSVRVCLRAAIVVSSWSRRCCSILSCWAEQRQRHIVNDNPCIRASVWMNWIDTQTLITNRLNNVCTSTSHPVLSVLIH